MRERARQKLHQLCMLKEERQSKSTKSIAQGDGCADWLRQ
jgi:hypothetical protein